MVTMILSIVRGLRDVEWALKNAWIIERERRLIWYLGYCAKCFNLLLLSNYSLATVCKLSRFFLTINSLLLTFTILQPVN
jgi:hypothetical protein